MEFLPEKGGTQILVNNIQRTEWLSRLVRHGGGDWLRGRGGVANERGGRVCKVHIGQITIARVT